MLLVFRVCAKFEDLRISMLHYSYETDNRPPLSPRSTLGKRRRDALPQQWLPQLPWFLRSGNLQWSPTPKQKRGTSPEKTARLAKRHRTHAGGRDYDSLFQIDGCQPNQSNGALFEYYPNLLRRQRLYRLRIARRRRLLRGECSKQGVIT